MAGSVKTIFRNLFGSQLYGTNTPASDTDYKSVHLPSAEEVLLHRTRHVVSSKTKDDPTAKSRLRLACARRRRPHHRLTGSTTERNWATWIDRAGFVSAVAASDFRSEMDPNFRQQPHEP